MVDVTQQRDYVVSSATVATLGRVVGDARVRRRAGVCWKRKPKGQSSCRVAEPALDRLFPDHNHTTQ